MVRAFLAKPGLRVVVDRRRLVGIEIQQLIHASTFAVYVAVTVFIANQQKFPIRIPGDRFPIAQGGLFPVRRRLLDQRFVIQQFIRMVVEVIGVLLKGGQAPRQYGVVGEDVRDIRSIE